MKSLRNYVSANMGFVLFVIGEVSGRMRARRTITLALCLTIAGIGAVFQSGGEPVCAQVGQACAPGNTTKTTICHVPPGNPQNQHTQCVANSAVQEHLANHPGDRVGECPAARSTCAPVTVTQLHGEGFVGNSRLARIEDGKVPCLHVETGEKSECLFSTDGDGASGSWLEATDGNYAKTGLSISLQGEPGGDYVVAAQVSEDATVPCVGVSGNDTIAAYAGEEATGTCSVETLNVAWNRTGLLLLNDATLEVCTSSYPHPDGATLVRTIPPPGDIGGTIYCYTGKGAALNDRNGTERDSWTGDYLIGEDYCHVIWSSGSEVPAAKRPATTSFPAPGTVRTNTPILWRPVNNQLRIAN